MLWDMASTTLGQRRRRRARMMGGGESGVLFVPSQPRFKQIHTEPKCEKTRENKFGPRKQTNTGTNCPQPGHRPPCHRPRSWVAASNDVRARGLPLELIVTNVFRMSGVPVFPNNVCFIATGLDVRRFSAHSGSVNLRRNTSFVWRLSRDYLYFTLCVGWYTTTS